MKSNKVALIISVVALIGVIVLSIGQFSNHSKSKSSVSSSTESGEAPRIAYVNIDSAVNSYDLYNKLSLSLMAKQQDLEKELQSKMLSLQNRAYKLQQQYSQHLITTQNYQTKAQKLSDEQVNLQSWQEQKAFELNEDQMNLTQRVYDSIVSVVKEINKDEKYDFVISNTTGGTLLYGNPACNITDEVIEILNNKVDATSLNDGTDSTVTK